MRLRLADLADSRFALALSAGLLFGCFGDFDVSAKHHPCSTCLACETCVAVVQGVAYCQAKQQHAATTCQLDGNVHSLDGCGRDEGVFTLCKNGGRCTQETAHEAVCECSASFAGPDCGQCTDHRDPAGNCTACTHAWSGEHCEVCPGHWDASLDCAACSGRWSGADCAGCIGHWDPQTECQSCSEGFVDQNDDCGTCIDECSSRGAYECRAGMARKCDVDRDGCLRFSDFSVCGDPQCNICAGSPGQVFDCGGVYGGTASQDHCGVCDADPSNDDLTCTKDCAGVWAGASREDYCGVCDADPSNDDLTCVEDCAGTWGGNARRDPCGVCDANPNNDCTLDCAGAPYGNARLDHCGVCNADASDDCKQDCAGIWGGNATLDGCGVCDNNPADDCTQDCAGVFGGHATLDGCGVCDNNPANDCTQDCAGVWGGSARLDNCGTCDSDPSNDCAGNCLDDYGHSGMRDDCGACDVNPSNDNTGCRSCVGAAPDCNSVSCCQSRLVFGDTFAMGRGSASDACPSDIFCNAIEQPEHNASISNFRLDRYEVTVGRYRKFVQAFAAGWRPVDGAGAHPRVAASGWRSAWDSTLPASDAVLRANLLCSARATWSDAPQGHEHAAINCLTWYEAFAFCTWDQGRLPTEAEWEFAAAGGRENRLFPWGSQRADSSLANYDGSAYLTDVGSHPAGASRYGQDDMAGQMTEYVLDWLDSGFYANGDCNDCALVDVANPTGSGRASRGGSYVNIETWQRAASRNWSNPSERFDTIGVRCARAE